MENQWIFSIDEVFVTEKVLGSGAFGEVKVAIWRKTEVACKRMHVLPSSESKCEVDTDFELSKEINILSKLRHPNLVQFLGVCIDPTSKLPTTILTEVMQYSIYDLLEIYKIRLNLPDILDISLDVFRGLNYLHSQTLPIVHRDISSKNVLISGCRAKISDLGQAKIFSGHASSRQTGMPGAMAYAAPEVLAGKYTEKIDIFSGGVLIVQMCIGEYPRIDKRENQLALACEKFPPLNTLMRSMLDFQPLERFRCDKVCEILAIIKSNDRYYPLSRRSFPQSDLSILAQRHMESEIALRTQETRIALDQSNKLLDAEERRWMEEASRADILENKLNASFQSMNELSNTIELMSSQSNETRQELNTRNEELTFKEESIKLLLMEKQRFIDRLQDMEVRLHDSTCTVDNLMVDKIQLHQQIESLSRRLSNAQVNEKKALMTESDLSIELSRVCEDSSELEVRLEQSLTRWRLECLALNDEKSKTAKLRATSANIIEQNSKLEAENMLMKTRLDQYFDLPQPKDIRDRIRDDSVSIKRLNDRNKILEESLSSLEKSHDNLSNELKVKENELKDMKSNLMEKTNTCNSMQSDMSDLSNRLKTSETSCIDLKESLDISEREKEDMSITHTKTLEELNKFHLFYRSMKLGMSNQGQSQILQSEDESKELCIKANDANDFNLESIDYSKLSLDAAVLNEELDQLASSDFRDNVTNDTKGGLRHDLLKVDKHMERETAVNERKIDAKAKLTVQLALEKDGITGLINILKCHFNDEKLSWRAARSTRELIINSDQARSECLNQHVDEVLLLCLTAFPTSVMVQGQCIRLLGALSYGSDLVRRRTGENGVMQLLVAAMEYHSPDETVQLHALTTVTNLTHNSIDNRSRFMEAGGISALLHTMKIYKQSSKLQRQACWAILTLCGNDELSHKIAQEGGGSALINAMVNHRLDAGVQQFGCWALGNMILAGDDMRRKLKKMGAVEVCRIAIESHNNDPEVLRQARNLFSILLIK